MKDKFISIMALLGSTGTLLCCVLPTVIVALAGGAALSTISPWLIPLSKYKIWIFIGSGIIISISGILILKPQSKLTCTILGGKGCEITGRFSKIILLLSFIIYFVGFSFTYLLVPFLRMLE
jgi:mercuric ion transport protein